MSLLVVKNEGRVRVRVVVTTGAVAPVAVTVVVSLQTSAMSQRAGPAHSAHRRTWLFVPLLVVV